MLRVKGEPANRRGRFEAAGNQTGIGERPPPKEKNKDMPGIKKKKSTRRHKERAHARLGKAGNYSEEKSKKHPKITGVGQDPGQKLELPSLEKEHTGQTGKKKGLHNPGNPWKKGEISRETKPRPGQNSLRTKKKRVPKKAHHRGSHNYHMKNMIARGLQRKKDDHRPGLRDYRTLLVWQ